jgi:hypothetical protein
VPDPFGLAIPFSLRATLWRVEVERRGRAAGARSDQIAELHQEVDVWEGRLEETRRRNEQVSRTLNSLLPSDAAGWRAWIASKVRDGLHDFPVRISMDVDTTDAIRPAITDGGSLLARVYYELAMDVSGARATAFCSACAQPYAVNRQPKRGQNNYCPACREAGVPQRLHMRRKRSGAS